MCYFPFIFVLNFKVFSLYIFQFWKARLMGEKLMKFVWEIVREQREFLSHFLWIIDILMGGLVVKGQIMTDRYGCGEPDLIGTKQLVAFLSTPIHSSSSYSSSSDKEDDGSEYEWSELKDFLLLLYLQISSFFFYGGGFFCEFCEIKVGTLHKLLKENGKERQS